VKRLILTALGVAVMGSGCATVPYRYGKEADYIGAKIPDNTPQIIQGRPNRFLDASDWIWPGSLFGKLLLWNHKVDSHQFSTRTVAAVEQYLADNELRDVKVHINAYHPGAELRRTVKNRSIGAGWRYTLGIFSWLGYTIMPGRFFGGDNYNPYSNTIHLYSDLIPVALHEGGHSKDFARRSLKGTYGFIYAYVPGFNLYPEALASNEALSYLRAKGDVPLSKSAYKLLYPAYGTYLGASVGDWVSGPIVYAVQAGVVIPAHIVGRVKAARVPEHLEPQPKPQVEKP
jgi:hypothetical protein